MNGRRANGLGGKLKTPRANSAHGAPCGAESTRQKTGRRWARGLDCGYRDGGGGDFICRDFAGWGG